MLIQVPAREMRLSPTVVGRRVRTVPGAYVLVKNKNEARWSLKICWSRTKRPTSRSLQEPARRTELFFRMGGDFLAHRSFDDDGKTKAEGEHITQFSMALPASQVMLQSNCGPVTEKTR